jgi:hypothetical protein
MLDTNQRKTVPPPARARQGLNVFSISGYRLGHVSKVAETGEFLLVDAFDSNSKLWLMPGCVFTVDQNVTLVSEYHGLQQYVAIPPDPSPAAA